MFIQTSIRNTGNKFNVIIFTLNTQDNAMQVMVLKKSYFLTQKVRLYCNIKRKEYG